jgi:methylglutaconyl-CoA hydratase
LNYKTIVIAESMLIRTITLNRPQHRNAMTPKMQMELIAALEDTADSSCRVLVLAGAGEAFCAGLDLSALHAMQDESATTHRADAERIARLFIALHELPVPTIAAVHGAAIAGGAGLAMICDFTLATPAAKFGFTEVRIGFVPALVSAFLAHQIGDKRSRDLLLTGRLFDAAEAYRMGLVNEIAAQDELMQRVQALADTLIANSPQSLKATKQLMATQQKGWLDSAVTQALEANAVSRETDDFREGITAFLEKRKPVWGKGSRAKLLRH